MTYHSPNSNRASLLLSLSLIALLGCASMPREGANSKRRIASSDASLICSLSDYGTPTEAANHAALPYLDLSIELQSSDSIKVTVNDNYYGGTENVVYTASYSAPSANEAPSSINGVKIGEYSIQGGGNNALQGGGNNALQGGGNNAGKKVQLEVTSQTGPDEIVRKKLYFRHVGNSGTLFNFACEVPNDVREDYSDLITH
jgi:hypothetical protein